MQKVIAILLLYCIVFICIEPVQAQIISRIAGSAGVTGYAGDGGPALSALVGGSTRGMVMDTAGNIFFCDYGNNRIRKVNTAGVITTVAGNGVPGSSGDGGPATDASIGACQGLAFDAVGNLYFGEGTKVRKVNTAGIISTVAGTGVSGYSGDGGPATAALLQSVYNVRFDGAGNLYIVDWSVNVVRKVDGAGTITTYAGSVSGPGFGLGEIGMPATAASLDYPTDIAFDATGNAYISLGLNWGYILKVDGTGTLRHIAGVPYPGTISDSMPATAARMGAPMSLAFDRKGNLIVGLTFDAHLRKIDTAGIVVAIAGNNYGGCFYYDVMPATAAPLPGINALCIDTFDNIYISNCTNICKIGRNSAPYFTGGAWQSITVCENGLADSLGTVLAVIDSDVGSEEHWSVLSAPAHGTAVLDDSGAYGGILCTPHHTYYQPYTGYVGNDTFKVRVTDGQLSDTITIYVTVANLPLTITGPGSVCAGSSITLSDSVGGGVWSSVPGTVTVGSGSGVVTGVSAGTATISYTMTASCGMSLTTRGVTVNPLPATITGVFTLCAGSSVTLITGSSGGVWSSASPMATVNSASGTVTGVSAGTATISYTLPTGCYTTAVVTINPLPGAITGTATLCVGGSAVLTTGPGGGAWSSSIPAVATVGSGSGSVTGVSAGTAAITYTLPTGCRAWTTVTIYPVPTAVSGPADVCPGSATVLYDGTGGGVWLSRNPAIATADSSTGYVTGVATGTVQIVYTMGGSCADSLAVTVHAAPAPVTGIAAVCVGTTTTLADTTSGGTWSSVSPGIATVGSATGIVTGTGTGTAMILYTTASCYAVKMVTVNLSPTAVTGVATVCAGGSATLSDGVSGGVWSSSNTAVATIGSSSGTYTGVSDGTAVMSYSMGAGCQSIFTITVNPLPGTITGTLNVCVGSSAVLGDTTAGGLWSSSTGTIAAIGSSGTVTGVSAGTATISYTLPTGCRRTATITVNPNPGAISGALHVCTGSSAVLTTSSGGGLWSSALPIATVNSTSGTVTGVSAGAATISYTLPTGCYSSRGLTVDAMPGAITGPGSVCAGSSVVLTTSPGGGTWTRSNTNVTIGGTTGVVTGISAGTTTITYTLPGGCYTTRTITVNTGSGGISGTLSVCVGSSTVLTTSSGGGTWSSASPMATVNSASGTVTGVSAGMATISYSPVSGCVSTAIVTVNPLLTPYTVSGGGSYCSGGTGLHISLGGSAAGTTYLLYVGGSPTGTALGGTGSPLDFGLQTAPGTYTVMATGAAGCTAAMSGSVVIAVMPPPPPIGGPSAVCVGSSAVLTTSSGGGAWSSGTPGVATINSTTGVVTGVAIGSTVITYTAPGGCYTTKLVSVSPSPTAISGPATVCAGSSATLSDGVSGGVWIAATPAVATIGSSSGVVSGVSAGTSVITYSLGSGCIVMMTMTVQPGPGAITGTLSVCEGSSAVLTTSSGGGMWSSSSTGTATVNSTTGTVTGISAGTATISYSWGGCTAEAVVTVNANPGTITGAGSVCAGSTAVLTTSSGWGMWSSGSTGTATVNSTTGTVTGVSAGTATISYTLPTGCHSTRVITVNTIPVVSGGGGGVCAGSTVILTVSGGSGGTWSSSSTGTATVNSTTGAVTGVSAGTATISYTLPTGCYGTKTVTVSAGPGTISGAGHVCTGSATTLTVSTGGGIWSSSSTGTATVNSASGTVTGVSVGTATITYTLGTGCTATKVMTTDPLPLPVSGGGLLCVGSTTTLTTGTGGGTWSSGSTGTATVNSTTGTVTGVSAGTATISYTLPTGCAATKTVTVSPPPSAITGVLMACPGTATTLSDAVGGGTWSSGATGTATVNSASGTVTGVSAGTAAITYSLGPGCSTTAMVTINPLPPGITGTAHACVGSSTVLTTSSGGGVWSSGATGTATVNSTTGIVTGVSGGMATISYTLPTGCAATYMVSVIAVPALSGVHALCAWGDTMTVSNTDTAGSYSSTGVTILNLGGGRGRVTANTPGTGTVTYTLPSGCSLTTVVTINPLPGVITGATDLCAGSSAGLSAGPGGGLWSSGATAIATVNSTTGMVTGVAAGTAIIAYTLPTGCKTDTVITVSTMPVAGTITGAAGICLGSSAVLTTSSGGGVWSSTSAVATVNSASGTVTGVAAGTDTIRYTVSNICGTAVAVKGITVNALPAAGTITGRDSICVGSSAVLTTSSGGGVWSTVTGAAAVNSASGAVTGVSGGTDTLVYTVTDTATLCSAATRKVIVVIPLALCPVLGVAAVAREARLEPNPARDEVVLWNAAGSRLRIYSIQGQQVMEAAVTTDRQAIDIRRLVPGVYITEIMSGDTMQRQAIRLVVE